jgi:hypothetical protein
MEFKFSISDILENFELEENEKENLVSLFEFTNYLFDDEENLTKTFKLAKKAREKLGSRIEEMFESEIKEIEDDFPAKEEEKQSD